VCHNVSHNLAVVLFFQDFGTKAYDAVRIALGEKIVRSHCAIELKDTQELEISFRPCGRTTRIARTGVGQVNFHTINHGNVLEMKYFLEDYDKVDEANNADKMMNFLAMRIQADEHNNLNAHKKFYKPDAGHGSPKRFLLVKFRSDREFRDFLETMKSTDWNVYLDKAKLDLKDAKVVCKSFLIDNKEDAQRRQSSVGSTLVLKKKNSFLQNKKDSDVLVVYPFGGDKAKMEEAAAGLQEAAVTGASIPVAAGSASSKRSGGRGHYLTVRVED
jgi:hypothetical protein